MEEQSKEKSTESIMAAMLKELEEMPADVFFKNVERFHYVCSDECFKETINKIFKSMEDGFINIDYSDIEIPEGFYNYLDGIKTHSRQVVDEDFPTYIDEFKDHGFIMKTIYGQGSIVIFEKFDFNSVEFKELEQERIICKEIKKEYNKKRRILKGLPKVYSKIIFAGKIGIVGHFEVLDVAMKIIKVTVFLLNGEKIYFEGKKEDFKKECKRLHSE